MPHYEFFCQACKKTFTTILALVEYEEESRLSDLGLCTIGQRLLIRNDLEGGDHILA